MQAVVFVIWSSSTSGHLARHGRGDHSLSAVTTRTRARESRFPPAAGGRPGRFSSLAEGAVIAETSVGRLTASTHRRGESHSLRSGRRIRRRVVPRSEVRFVITASTTAAPCASALPRCGSRFARNPRHLGPGISMVLLLRRRWRLNCVRSYEPIMRPQRRRRRERRRRLCPAPASLARHRHDGFKIIHSACAFLGWECGTGIFAVAGAVVADLLGSASMRRWA